MVCNYMRNEFRWGVSDFVKALASSTGSNNTRRRAAFSTAAYEDLEVLSSYFDDTDQLWDSRRKSIIEILDLGKNELRKEVERLGSIMPFNKYDPALSGQFDSLDMDQTLLAVQEQAPLLLQLIRDIIAPDNRPSHQNRKEPAGHILTIISILCFTQHKITSTGFQTTLGLYLHSNGVKRQQMDLLSRLGLTVSYNTIIGLIKEQSTQAAERVKSMGQGDASVTAYDNFEVMESVKEQRVDHQSSFHSVTTGQVIQGIEIPPGGLRQDMLDPQAKISSMDVFLAPGNLDDDIQRQVSPKLFPTTAPTSSLARPHCPSPDLSSFHRAEPCEKLRHVSPRIGHRQQSIG
jgi:hypothetical protein